MKQTAVDYLFEQLWDTPKDKFIWQSILSQAKAREKDEILDAVIYCLPMEIEEATKEAEEYYKEVYE
jgi:hypothetical protein